jgi:integrase
LLKKTKSYSAIHNYVAAIIAFYKINDIILNVDKIARFMPEKRRANKDRGYEHEEILKLLGVADERMRVVILLLASTGMRIGAIPSLRLRNLEEIEIENSKIYKITVYENDREEHFTFCTPECAKAIYEYLEMRKRYGEKLTDESFLVREQFDIRDPFAISKCQKTIANTLVNKIILLAERSGIRTRQTLEENHIPKHLASSFRKDVAVCHGFRKFFTMQLVNSKLNPEIREMLMGHKIGLASVYYKPSDDDFLIEYQKAINNLTINEVNKLKMQVKKLEIEKSQLEKLAQDVAILKRKWRSR